MNLDLVKIVNKHVPDSQTFVFADGVAHIFWEGVLFQFSCDAELRNGIYDRNLRLVKKIDSFSFFDLMAGNWLPIGFPRLKDFCKVSPTGPEMILCVEDGQEEASLHLCSKGMAHNIPNRLQKFSADLVSRYLGLLKKNEDSARANFRGDAEGGVIMVELGDHRIYFLTQNILEKFRAAVARYTAEVIHETGEDNKLYRYAQQPLALEA